MLSWSMLYPEACVYIQRGHKSYKASRSGLDHLGERMQCAAAGPRETSETRSGHGADVADEDAAPEAGLPGPPASNGRGMRTSEIYIR